MIFSSLFFRLQQSREVGIASHAQSVLPDNGQTFQRYPELDEARGAFTSSSEHKQGEEAS
jgi:hypothetical protein